MEGIRLGLLALERLASTLVLCEASSALSDWVIEGEVDDSVLEVLKDVALVSVLREGLCALNDTVVEGGVDGGLFFEDLEDVVVDSVDLLLVLDEVE